MNALHLKTVYRIVSYRFNVRFVVDWRHRGRPHDRWTGQGRRELNNQTHQGNTNPLYRYSRKSVGVRVGYGGKR
jgi:hypothetical protein